MVQRADLDIYQGDDFGATVQVSNPDGTPADLTGYTARAQIRASYADIMPAYTDLGATVAAGGVVNIMLASAATRQLGAGVWDLQLTDAGGRTSTILAGSVRVTKEVTR